MIRYATVIPAGQTTQTMVDSLPSAVAPTPPLLSLTPTDPEGFRIVSPSELFGAQSHTLPPPEWNPESFSNLSSMVDSTVFKLFVVLVFVGYCALIHYYRDAVAETLKSLRSKLYSEKLVDEQNYTFSQFLNAMTFAGILSFSVLSIRAATLLLNPEQLAGTPGWSVPMVPFSVVCVWLVIGIYQWIVMRTAAGIIREPIFFDRLIMLRRILASIGVIVVTPFILLFALNQSASVKTLFYLIVSLIVAFILFFVFKTIRYFIEQKISFLYWILYLCAVEIFPISVFIALSVRYM